MGKGLAFPSYLRPPPDNTTKTDGRSFPTGVIIEILSRLPIKALAQCQLICKDWLSLIRDHYFTEIHLDRGHVSCHWYNAPLTTEPRKTYTFSYKHGCNGLIILMNIDTKKHYIWNPAIRGALELPDPHYPSLGFAFSYVPSTRNYRIVSFYKALGKSLHCQVITPGLDAAWREMEPPEIEKAPVERVSVVLSQGAVHYVQVTKAGMSTNVEVVSLDLETEKFTASRFPESSKDYWDLDWEGKLGFANIVGENLEVVEMEDYRSGRWSEEKRVVRLAFKNRENVIPLFAKKGEIWFWLKGEKTFRYEIDTGRCIDDMLVKSMSFSTKTFVYKPSLISFEGMVPDTEFESLRSWVKF